MSVFELPDSVNIHGVNLSKPFYTKVVEDGTDYDKYKLNKDTDIVIATYPRTGGSKALLVIFCFLVSNV